MLPSWLTGPLWDQFAALLPERPTVGPSHPLGCHRPRISDRIVFDKLLQLLRFGCSYQAISDTTCSATTIRNPRDEWIRLGVFTRLKQIALESYDRIVGLVLDQIAVDDLHHQGPRRRRGRRALTGRPRQTGPETLGMTDGYGIPLGRVLAGANRHDSPLLAPTLDLLDDLRCYERRSTVVNAFFDLADTIITVRSLIRRAWTTHRWDTPRRCP